MLFLQMINEGLENRKMKKAELIVADSEKSADMLYASGFRAVDAFVFFRCGSEKGIILSALEHDRGIRERHPDVNVLRMEEFASGGGGMVETVQALANKLAITEYVVPKDFPLYLADALRGGGLSVVCKNNDFFPERRHKSSEEISKIAHAMRITEKGMRRAGQILAEAQICSRSNEILIWQGELLTAEILRFEINLELMRFGAVAESTIVACGQHGAEPHNIGTGPLVISRPLVIDIFPRLSATGYWGDITRTFVKGRAPEIVKRAFDAVKATRDCSKELIKAGAIPSEVYLFAVKKLEDYGFPTGQKDGRNYGFFHSLGHSVGLEIHENPRLGPKNHTPLSGGEVLTVEPGVYYPEWGGMRLEDMVVVTADGCECLTEFETVLEIP